MKTFKTLVVLVAFAFSTVAIASTKPVISKLESSVITNQIVTLLESPQFILENEVSAYVTIAVNKNNEMVVLSIDTENVFVANFIKERLNYKELSVTNSPENKFIVPVRIITAK